MALRNAIEGAARSIYIRARLAEERLRSGVVWWPLAPDFIADPYPAYRQLRDRDPVHRGILTRQIVVSRFADVDRILRDHRNYSNDLQSTRSSYGSLGTRKKLKPSMLALDPPDHTRLRRLVNRAFTPRSVAKMQDYIRATAHVLLDEVDGSEEFDLMTAFAVPLPTIVIARMIGVPERDLDRFKVWSDQLARALEPLLSKEEQEEVVRADRKLAEYFTGVIEERRREPRDDLVSRLVEAEDEGDKLTAGETIVMLRLLLVAGNETTTNLIGNGVRALLRNPGQLTLLREQPELVPAAVEELLRYDSPVQLDMRIARGDLEIGGRKGAAGVHDRPAHRVRQSRSRTVRAPPAGSTTPGPTRATSRSAAAFITAWALRSRGWKAESRWRCCSERFGTMGFGARQPKHRPSVVLRGLEHFDVRVA